MHIAIVKKMLEGKRNVQFMLLLVFLFSFAGLCTRDGGVPADVGIFKSSDFGVNYEQKNQLPDDKRLDRTSILGITIDTFDTDVMYAVSKESGIFKTTNGGEEWERAGLETGTFYRVAVDPKNNRNIYAAGIVDEVGRIYRSSNGGKEWKEVYRETNPGSKVFDVAIDHFDTTKMYAITENGAFLKSEDNGDSWVVTSFFVGRALFLRMSHFDSRIMYVSSPDIGIQKTIDAGETWERVEIDEELFPGANSVFDFRFHPTDDRILFVSTSYGLLKSEDSGLIWTDKPLLIRPGENSLMRFVLDPLNPDNIYLSLDNAMYRSRDGGDTWTVKEKITTSQIYALEINPEKPENVYLGVWHRGK